MAKVMYLAVFIDRDTVRAEVFNEEELDTIPTQLEDMSEDVEHLQIIQINVPEPKEKKKVVPVISAVVNLGE